MLNRDKITGNKTPQHTVSDIPGGIMNYFYTCEDK